MRKRLVDVLKLFFPLGFGKRRSLRELKGYLSKPELSDVTYLARLRWVGFHHARHETSKEFFPDESWPQLGLGVADKELEGFVKRVNQKITDHALLRSYRSFRNNAIEKIASLVASNIIGMDVVKEAAALQLFAREPFHILLIGDPGTGKTEVLRSIERVASQALFGLGSGASKAGLIGSYEGKEFHPGLLVSADEGIACIDELNLLKKEDRAGLYSAMEKGFVTLDKKGKHERFDARIRVLATANPKGDSFKGKDVKFLKAQLPFDDALLSRFHLLFLIRKAKGKELEQITRKIVRGDVRNLEDADARFVQGYTSHAEKLEVSFDKKYESMVVNFIEDVKSLEQNYLVEVGPRTVVGVIRLAKAYARARLSRHTSADDIERAMKLVKAALTVRQE